MRREGFEMQVSKPQVIYKKIDGAICEPYEEVTITADSEFMGTLTEEFGKRKLFQCHQIGIRCPEETNGE